MKMHHRSTTSRPTTRRPSSFTPSPNGPLPADAKPGQGIHHPRFGEALKAKLDPLGIECILHHRERIPAGR